MKEVITIDGPSGSGKSTVSKVLARRLGYRYLDTGALYRAVAWKIREDGTDINNEPALQKALLNMDISVSGGKISVNGVDVSLLIRTAEIGELSSVVSAIPAVRDFLFLIQREAGLEGKVVVEGRDTGTVIFPEAEHKFFLDANLHERAKRRTGDLRDKDPRVSIEETTWKLQERDTRDSTRINSPLKMTADMVYIDSSSLTVEEVVEAILTQLKRNSGV